MPEIIEMKRGRDGTYQESSRTPIGRFTEKVQPRQVIQKSAGVAVPQVDILGEIHKAAEGYLINFVRSFL